MQKAITKTKRERFIVPQEVETEERVRLAFHLGLSYKAIERKLGITHEQIAYIRKRTGVSCKTYRDGYGPFGTLVATHVTITPIENVKQIAIQLKKDLNYRQLKQLSGT